MKPMIRIVAPHFTAAIEVGGRAAPILNFMMGWSEDAIVKYCERKGWKREREPARKIIFDHLDAASADEVARFSRCARAMRATTYWAPEYESRPRYVEPKPVSGEITEGR